MGYRVLADELSRSTYKGGRTRISGFESLSQEEELSFRHGFLKSI